MRVIYRSLGGLGSSHPGDICSATLDVFIVQKIYSENIIYH